MRKALALLLVLTGLLHARHGYCQGWAWGRTASHGTVEGWTVATDHSGNVYAGAFVETAGPLDFGGGVSLTVSTVSTVAWVKYDNAGTALWAGNVDGHAMLHAITTDRAGNLIVFGSFSGSYITIGGIRLNNTHGSGEYFLTKISPSGTVLWAIADGDMLSSGWMTIGAAVIMSQGGVATDAAGNIYITGTFADDMPLATGAIRGGGGCDAFAIKYTPAGSLAWATAIGGAGDDFGLGITAASDGNVYVSGAYFSTAFAIGASLLVNPSIAKPYAFIAKINSSGRPVWGQGEGGINGAFGTGIVSDNYGNVYMTGGFCDTSISFGDTVLRRAYPTDVPDPALFLVQYSNTGVVSWRKTIGSVSTGVWGFTIAVASCGQIWVSGVYRSDALMDTAIIHIVGGSDPIFIAGYDLHGHEVGHAGLASGGDDQNGIAADPYGNVFISSDFESTLAIGADVLSSAGDDEYFYVGKYNNSVTVPDTTNLVKDTTACGASGVTGVQLKATSGYTNYYWDDGSTDSTRVVTAAGTYFVYALTCGSTVLIDTFHVAYTAPSDSAHASFISNACGLLGDTLTAPPGYDSYTWSTGSFDAAVFVTAAGVYVMHAISGSSGCRMLTDTFHVSFTLPRDTSRLHTDTSMCYSATNAILTGRGGYTSYLWSTGSTDSFIIVTTAGSYVLQEVSAACGLVVDTFHFSIRPDDSTIAHTDTSVCPPAIRMTLTAPAGYDAYTWSTGVAGPAITVGISGHYRAYCRTGCSVLVDTFNATFNPSPVVNLGRDTGFCTGRSLTLSSVQPAGSSFAWSTGSTATSITVAASGAYWLHVTSAAGCSATDTIHVLVSPVPAVNLGPDITGCPGTATLASTITYPTGTAYLWSTGAGTPSISATAAGLYWLRVTVGGCPNADTLVIRYVYDSAFTAQNDSMCSLAGPAVLTAPAGYTSWQWSTGSSAPFISVSTAGDYRVDAYAGCNVLVDTIHFSIIPADSAFGRYDTAICTYAAPLTITAPPGYTAWQWNTGSAASSISAPATGYYWVQCAAGCSLFIDTFYVRILPSPDVRLGNDTAFCAGDSLILTPAITAGAAYSWSTGSAAPSITVSATGVYWLYATLGDACGITDSIYIYVRPLPVISLRNDTGYCTGDTLTLYSPEPLGSTYLWSTGSTADSIRVTVAGKYWLTVNDSNCQAADTSYAAFLHTTTISRAFPNTGICKGESVQLHDTGATKFTWIPAKTLNNAFAGDPLAHPDTTTTYEVIAQMGNCAPDTNYVTIIVNNQPWVDAGPGQTIEAGASATLQPTATMTEHYYWTPPESLSCDSCQNPVATPSVTTTYTVTVTTNAGCISTDTVTIHLVCDSNQIFIPNTFTPNGDGQNDVFYPRGRGIIQVKSFRIYNRWGEMLFSRSNFSLNDASNAWDGSYLGDAPRPGVYVYIVDAVCDTGAPISLKGDVTVVK